MKKLYYFFLIMMLLMASQSGPAQTWESVGPQGANIVSIQTTSTSMFAAGYIANVSSGFWRSGNNGQTWENLISNFPNKKIRTMWTRGDTIIVSIAPNNVGGIAQIDGGAFQSIDNGNTWTTLWVNTGFNEPEAYLKKGIYIFLGTGLGIYRSSDEGLSWTLLTGGQSGSAKSVNCFETSGDTIFIGTHKGLFRSVNNCTTWTPSGTGIPTTVNSNFIIDMARVGSVLYASTLQLGVYKSTNVGVSWVASNTGLTELRTNAIYYNGTALFVGTSINGVFKSTDGGDSWFVSNQGMVGQDINYFFQNGSNLLTGGMGGISQSPDNGATWTDATNGLTGHVIGTGGQTPTVLTRGGGYLFAFSYQGRMFRSADNGINWQPVATTLRVIFYAIAANSTAVFASSSGGLYKSVDWGENWSLIAFPEGSPEDMLVANNKIYGVKYNNIYYTEDDGITWVQMVIPEMMNRMTKMGHDIYVNGGYDYGNNTQHYHQIYRSVNGTSAFTYVGNIVSEGSLVRALGSQGSILYASTAQLDAPYTANGISRSIDNGVTWTFDGLAGIEIVGFASDSNHIFARSKWNFYVRNNVENTWININWNIPIDLQCAYSSGLLADNDKLFASGASKSLYATDISIFNLPVQPGPISGSGTPCIGSSQTYSVTNIPGVTYTWQFPIGWLITSGQNTNSVNVTVGSIPGTVMVTPTTFMGSGPYQFRVVMPNNNPPAQPSIISGSTNPLEGDIETYSVTNDPGVSYAWTFPTGWVQTAGGTTNSVTVTVGSGSGDITVTPSTPCGTGTPRTLAVVPTLLGFTVTFNVDMSTAEGFIPGTDLVYLTGNFPGASWVTPGDPGSLVMTQVGSTLVYTYSMLMDAGSYEYKYFKNAGWGGGEYAGGPNRLAAISASATINDTWGGTINWANLQWPGSGTIDPGGAYDVYAQANIPNGITSVAGLAYGLQAWIGYSTSNTDPATWTNWVAAPFFNQAYDNDEFKVNLGAAITTAGTYYYASRFQFGAAAYVYGGFNGGFWNGTSNISGVLTVAAVVPEIVNLENVVVADGQTTCYGALQTIYVAGGITTFTVQSGGSATMIAGQNIVYLPGTMVEAGGYMHGYISTVFCTNPSNPVVNNPESAGDVATSLKESSDAHRIIIYPNPTTGLFTLEQSGFENDQNLQLEIYSMLGKRMLLDNIMGEKQHQFNLGNVPNGVYMVRIKAGEQVKMIKLIKQ